MDGQKIFEWNIRQRFTLSEKINSLVDEKSCIDAIVVLKYTSYGSVEHAMIIYH